MRYIKILGLLAVAAAATMAFAATASAEVATSPTGTTYTSTFKAESEGHVVMHNPIAKIECASSLEGSITDHGAGKNVTISWITFGLSACTQGWHSTVVFGGVLSAHSAGGYNGDVFWSGMTMESTIKAGEIPITCRYAASNITLGNLTGGNPATLDISANMPFHSGSPFCGAASTSWTGSYKVSTPSSLYIDNT